MTYRTLATLLIPVAMALAGCSDFRGPNSTPLRPGGSTPIIEPSPAAAPAEPSTAPPADAAPEPQATGPSVTAPADPRVLPTFAGDTGAPISWSELLARCESADVVLIGEMHGHATGLAVAAALFEDLAARNGSAALSMEFFERDQQLALDDYLAGVIDEAAFLRLTGRAEGNYPAGHRAMIEAAKAHGLPVIASNAPRRYVRLARTEGLDRIASLGDSQRQMYAVPSSLTEGQYRDRFLELMGGPAAHGADPAAPASAPRPLDDPNLAFFRSQNVWDATMADSIVRALDYGHRPVVHVVGQFHVDRDGGLTQRLRSARPGVRLLVVSMSDAAGSALAQEDNGRAEVVVNVGG